MAESREITPEEGRELVLNHIAAIFKYWRDLPADRLHLAPGETELHSRMSGFLFSLFVMFDGGCMDLPAFDIVPAPHPEDKAFAEENGENWWSSEKAINDTQLHEIFPWKELK